MKNQKLLIENMLNPHVYDHETYNFRIIETSISWVILTGKFAFKIKKAILYGPIDYSTLERRNHFCKKEVEVNQSLGLAKDIYIESVKITGSISSPKINGDENIIEYAVKMKQFNSENCLDKLIMQDKEIVNKFNLIEKLGKRIAHFHKSAALIPEDFKYEYHKDIFEIFSRIKPALIEKKDDYNLVILDKLKGHLKKENERLAEIFKIRKERGFVKSCHGDIHFSNIVLIDKEPTIFDCIDFDDDFRFIDTIADFSFLMVDLHCQTNYTYAISLLSFYINETKDYQGLNIIAFYLIHRSLVLAAREIKQDSEKYKNYIGIASDYLKKDIINKINSLYQEPIIFNKVTFFPETGLKEKSLANHNENEIANIGVIKARL